MQRNSVLFPPPDGPTITATSPRPIVIDTPASTVLAPWRLTIFATSITSADASHSTGNMSVLSFQPACQNRQRKAHKQIQGGGGQPKFDKRLRRAIYRHVVPFAQFFDSDHRTDRRVLEQVDEIIGHGRNDQADSL